MWWNEALAVWCAMTGAVPEIVDQAANPSGSQNPGTWWTESIDGRWCVQLDDTHFAVLSGTMEPAERNALTWMLKTALSAQRRPRPEGLADRLRDLAERDSRVLAGLVAANPNTALPCRLAIDPAAHPGFLIWVRFERQIGASDTDDSVKSSVEDVLDAWPPIMWRCWTPAIENRLSLLIFVDRSQVDDLPDADAGTSEASGVPTSSVRLLAEDVVDLVEQDAMRPCTAAISLFISDTSGLDAGLASLVLAERSRTALLRRQRAVQFGQFPLVHLVQALPISAHAMLDQWSLGSVLSPDTKDTLRAMIQANLNVSEAARLLYMHRNTLLNRIDRIRAETTHDIRTLSGAATLWIVYLMHHT